MDEDGVVQETQPHKENDGWLQRAKADLDRRLPCILLITGVLLYILVLIFQASGDDIFPTQTRTVSAQTGKAELTITYPQKLFRDGPNKIQTLSAWLTHTSTVSTSAPYFIVFKPITNGIDFVSQTEEPITPRIVFTPTLKAPARAVLRLRQVNLAPGVKATTTLIAHLFDSNGSELIKGGVAIPIKLEKAQEAFWRRLVQRLLSPATPLLALAIGILTLAIQERRQALEAEKQALYQKKLAKVQNIHLCIPYELGEAVKQYDQYKRLAEMSPEWKTKEITTSLRTVWEAITQHDWQNVVLDKAVTQLQAGEFIIASKRVKLVLRLDSENQVAQDLDLIIKLAQAYLYEKIIKTSDIEPLDAKRVIDTLQRVYRRYTPQLDNLTKQSLSSLQGDPNYGQEIQKLLVQNKIGQELLHQTSWPALWSSTERDQANTKVSRWLKKVGLDFNPFGPEVAEHDPYLPWYVTQTVYEEAQAPHSLVVTGAPGIGKTATALMLAYDCGHPPANPRIAGAFPVYFAPRLARTISQENHSTLYLLVRATAREILAYLSLRPEGLFDLPPARRDTLRHFLTLVYAGSETWLSVELDRLPAEVQKALALLPLLKSRTQPPHLLDEEWLVFLPEVLPAGFNHYLWLVDTPDHVISFSPETLSIDLSQLMDWAIYLSSFSIYLKLFISEQKLERLATPAGLRIVRLEWQDKDLKQMLSDRVHQAGVDSLMALCGPNVETDCEEKLIKTAQGSPRRLIKLGNALIESASDRAPKDPQLTWQDFEGALASIRKAEAILKQQASKLKLARLHQLLVAHFAEGELQTLCLELGMDYENLPAIGKANKARELIEYLDRRGRLAELVAIGKKQRPNVSWVNES